MNPQLLSHVSWLDSARDEMLDLLIRLCDTNSGTFNLPGLDTVMGILIEAYSELGARHEVLEIDPVESIDDQGRVVSQPLGKLLRIRKHPTCPIQVLLCIHMDTVYGADHAFQKCNWLDSNRLNGPGVIDAKGGLVTMLYSLLALERSPWAGRMGWTVLINPDEEIGSPGSHRLLKASIGNATAGLLFEPALPDGSLVSWRKGVGNFSVIVRGRSAHSGRNFEQGRNAVVALSRLMIQIHELNRDPEVTLNVGRVSGGTALNVVPDLAIGRINVRVRTMIQAESVLSEIRKLVSSLNDSGEGFSAEIHGSFTSPPKEMIPGTESLQRRIELAGDLVGIPVQWKGTGGGSDGNKFSAEGLPNIDSLGPEGGEIHSVNEFLLADSLIPRTKLASLVLMSMAEE